MAERASRRRARPAVTNGHDLPAAVVGAKVTDRQSPDPSPQLPVAVNARPRGRLTQDYIAGRWGPQPVMLPPPDYEAQWQTFNLDSDTFSKLTPAQLLSILGDISPDVSRALWDFLRLFNPGWELVVRMPGRDDQHLPGQYAAEAIMTMLSSLYGTVDVIHGRMAMSMFMRGALLTELVLGPNGRDVIDLVVPDPTTVRFKRVIDPDRGTVDKLGQWQTTGFVDLSERVTIGYVPVDPAPGSPYGRPMVSPALFSSLFLLGVLHDLRRVLSQQGYPRIDVEIDLEQLAKEAPVSVKGDAIKWRDWVQRVFDEVRNVYASLEPDDAYIHTSAVKVNKPIGTANASSLGAVPSIIEIIERWTVRALKTMPVLMGTRQGNTETQANREWEIMTAGFKSIQHYAEATWERQLTLGLRAQGIQAEVQFRYAELRASEMDRDAKTEQTLIMNELLKVLYGWQDNDAAALKITGHPALAAFPPVLPPNYQEVGADDQSAPPEDGETSDEGPVRMARLWQMAGMMRLDEAMTWSRNHSRGVPGRWVRVYTQRGPQLRYQQDTRLSPPDATEDGSLPDDGLPGLLSGEPDRRAPENAFTPSGSPLPEHQGDVTIGAAELRKISKSWNDRAPSAYEDLLEATVDA